MMFNRERFLCFKTKTVSTRSWRYLRSPPNVRDALRSILHPAPERTEGMEPLVFSFCLHHEKAYEILPESTTGVRSRKVATVKNKFEKSVTTSTRKALKPRTGYETNETYQECLSLNLNSLNGSTLSAFRYYPKTSVQIGGPDLPTGPKTVNESFKWAKVFLERLFKHFGRSKVCKKLQQWRWDCSTSFSGLGCAETELNLELWFESVISSSWIKLKPKVSTPTLSSFQTKAQMVSSEAILSLQAAVNEVTQETWAPHARILWACEKDVDCQQVLMDSYSSCLFGNMMEFDLPHQKQLWCLKHEKMCNCDVPVVPKRNSA